MKRCSVCKRSDVEFGKNKNKKDGLQVQCKICQAQTSAKHYLCNKEKQLERIYERRNQLRQSIFDYFKEHPCVDCGETDPIVLEYNGSIVLAESTTVF